MTSKRVSQRQRSGNIYALPKKLPDPPRICDVRQRRDLSLLDGTLMPHFADRPDVLVCGSGYLCYRTTDPASTRLEPDGLVAFGIDPDAVIIDNGYIIDDVGKPPDFVLEVASRSTGRRDYTVKRAGYARFGVGEYWRFDHTGGRYHDAPLAGDLLVGERYEPLELADDRPGKMYGMLSGYSPALDLYLCWDQGKLRFYDPKTDEFLLDPLEMVAVLYDVQAERDTVQDERDAERIARLTTEIERDNAIAERDAAAAERDAANERIRQLTEKLRDNQA